MLSENKNTLIVDGNEMNQSQYIEISIHLIHFDKSKKHL